MSTQSASAYAIIRTGGKQYRVKEGQRFKFEKLAGEVGDTVDLGDVILLADGDKIQVGAPLLDKAKVTAKILSHGRGDKVTIIKMRRRKGYRRKQAHRQLFTEAQITNI